MLRESKAIRLCFYNQYLDSKAILIFIMSSIQGNIFNLTKLFLVLVQGLQLQMPSFVFDYNLINQPGENSIFKVRFVIN